MSCKPAISANGILVQTATWRFCPRLGARPLNSATSDRMIVSRNQPSTTAAPANRAIVQVVEISADEPDVAPPAGGMPESKGTPSPPPPPPPSTGTDEKPPLDGMRLPPPPPSGGALK